MAEFSAAQTTLTVVFRYFWLFVIGALGVELTYGRARAARLVDAGRVTREELDGFVRGAVALLGGYCLLFAILQGFAHVSHPLCLTTFPPQSIEGVVLWIGQALVSLSIITWLWAHDGARILARLAPAFTRGPVLEREFSPRNVALVVTAVVVIAPLGNIVLQLSQPVLPSACSAV